MARRWTIRSTDDILLEEVDDFLCCYCRATGRTHLLDAFPREILQLLSDSPRSEEQLGRSIAEQVGEEAGPWVERVGDVLDELRTLRLVEPVAP